MADEKRTTATISRPDDGPVMPGNAATQQNQSPSKALQDASAVVDNLPPLELNAQEAAEIQKLKDSADREIRLEDRVIAAPNTPSTPEGQNSPIGQTTGNGGDSVSLPVPDLKSIEGVELLHDFTTFAEQYHKGHPQSSFVDIFAAFSHTARGAAYGTNLRLEYLFNGLHNLINFRDQQQLLDNLDVIESQFGTFATTFRKAETSTGKSGIVAFEAYYAKQKQGVLDKQLHGLDWDLDVMKTYFANRSADEAMAALHQKQAESKETLYKLYNETFGKPVPEHIAQQLTTWYEQNASANQVPNVEQATEYLANLMQAPPPPPEAVPVAQTGQVVEQQSETTGPTGTTEAAGQSQVLETQPSPQPEIMRPQEISPVIDTPTEQAAMPISPSQPIQVTPQVVQQFVLSPDIGVAFDETRQYATYQSFAEQLQDRIKPSLPTTPSLDISPTRTESDQPIMPPVTRQPTEMEKRIFDELQSYAQKGGSVDLTKYQDGNGNPNDIIRKAALALENAKAVYGASASDSPFSDFATAALQKELGLSTETIAAGFSQLINDDHMKDEGNQRRLYHTLSMAAAGDELSKQLLVEQAEALIQRETTEGYTDPTITAFATTLSTIDEEKATNESLTLTQSNSGPPPELGLSEMIAQTQADTPEEQQEKDALVPITQAIESFGGSDDMIGDGAVYLAGEVGLHELYTAAQGNQVAQQVYKTLLENREAHKGFLLEMINHGLSEDAKQKLPPAFKALLGIEEWSKKKSSPWRFKWKNIDYTFDSAAAEASWQQFFESKVNRHLIDLAGHLNLEERPDILQTEYERLLAKWQKKWENQQKRLQRTKAAEKFLKQHPLLSQKTFTGKAIAIFGDKPIDQIPAEMAKYLGWRLTKKLVKWEYKLASKTVTFAGKGTKKIGEIGWKQTTAAAQFTARRAEGLARYGYSPFRKWDEWQHIRVEGNKAIAQKKWADRRQTLKLKWTATKQQIGYSRVGQTYIKTKAGVGAVKKASAKPVNWLKTSNSRFAKASRLAGKVSKRASGLVKAAAKRAISLAARKIAGLLNWIKNLKLVARILRIYQRAVAVVGLYLYALWLWLLGQIGALIGAAIGGVVGAAAGTYIGAVVGASIGGALGTFICFGFVVCTFIGTWLGGILGGFLGGLIGMAIGATIGAAIGYFVQHVLLANLFGGGWGGLLGYALGGGPGMVGGVLVGSWAQQIIKKYIWPSSGFSVQMFFSNLFHGIGNAFSAVAHWASNVFSGGLSGLTGLSSAAAGSIIGGALITSAIIIPILAIAILTDEDSDKTNEAPLILSAGKQIVSNGEVIPYSLLANMQTCSGTVTIDNPLPPGTAIEDIPVPIIRSGQVIKSIDATAQNNKITWVLTLIDNGCQTTKTSTSDTVFLPITDSNSPYGLAINFCQGATPLGCSKELAGIYQAAAEWANVPAGVIAGIANQEWKATFKHSDAEIAQWSKPGVIVEPNGPTDHPRFINGCAESFVHAMGPMQFMVGKNGTIDVWKSYKDAAISAAIRDGTYTPEACNIVDAIFASAMKLKSNSGMPFDSKKDAWTKDDVYRVAKAYLGACVPNYNPNINYCEGVWQYYQTFTPRTL